MGIVENVEMAEGGAFRGAGRAAGKLDVAGIIGLQFLGKLLQPREVLWLAEFRDGFEVETAAAGLGAEPDHAAKLWQPRRLKLVRLAVIELGRNRPQHVDECSP